MGGFIKIISPDRNKTRYDWQSIVEENTLTGSMYIVIIMSHLNKNYIQMIL